MAKTFLCLPYFQCKMLMLCHGRKRTLSILSNFTCRGSGAQTNLTHRGRVTHIYVGNLTFIGSDNGVSPGRHQAIIRMNDRILLIRPLGTKVREILIESHIFYSMKRIWKCLYNMFAFGCDLWCLVPRDLLSFRVTFLVLQLLDDCFCATTI